MAYKSEKKNVFKFIAALCELYNQDFTRRIGTPYEEDGSLRGVFLCSFQPFEPSTLSHVVRSLSRGEHEFFGGCPSITELVSLCKSHERNMRLLDSTKQLPPSQATSFMNGTPTGFGKYQSIINEKHNQISDDVKKQAMKLKGREYASFMMEHLGCSKSMRKIIDKGLRTGGGDA